MNLFYTTDLRLLHLPLRVPPGRVRPRPPGRRRGQAQGQERRAHEKVLGQAGGERGHAGEGRGGRSHV